MIKSHENRLLKLLEVNSTTLILITGQENLLKTLTVYLVYRIVIKEILQLVSVDLTVTVLVQQLEHFLQVLDLEQLILFQRWSQKLSIINLSVFVNIYRIH